MADQGNYLSDLIENMKLGCIGLSSYIDGPQLEMVQLKDSVKAIGIH